MKPTPDSCAADLVELATAIVHGMRRTIRQSDELAITLVQVRALAVVARHPGISVSRLAEQVGLGFSASSTLADALVRRKLLTRRPAAEDRRRAVLAPTPAGSALLRRVRQASSRQLAQRLAGLPAPALAAIAAATAALRPVVVAAEVPPAEAGHG